MVIKEFYRGLRRSDSSQEVNSHQEGVKGIRKVCQCCGDV